MRKFVGTIVLLGVESGAMFGLETTILPFLSSKLGYALIMTILSISALAIWAPEIKTWVDRSERVIRKADSKYERDRRVNLKARIQASQKTGILRNVAYDRDTDRITGDIIRHSWKRRWVGYATWLMNRRQVNRSKRLRSVYFWFLKRMGYAVREAREGEVSDLEVGGLHP